MAAAGSPAPAAASTHLERLLDQQPACLIRVGLDATLLACNDAALALFGARSLDAILETNLTDRLIAEERPQWAEFAARVFANGAASLECHLGPAGDALPAPGPDPSARGSDPGTPPRPVLLQAVALKDHPDGLESLLIHIRDQSQTQRLERLVQSAETTRAALENREGTLRAHLEAVTAERARLAQRLEEQERTSQRLTRDLEAQIADREKTEARRVEVERKLEDTRLAGLAAERRAADRLAVLESELMQARNQGATAEAGLQRLAEEDRQREQIIAKERARVTSLEQLLAKAGEQAARAHEQAQRTLADMKAQLSRAVSEQQRLAALVGEYERQSDRLKVEQRRVATELEAVHHKALADLRAEQAQTVADLRAQLAHASAEQTRLAARVDEQERQQDRLSIEHCRAIAELDAGKRAALSELQALHAQAIAELRGQLTVASAQYAELVARMDDQEREHDRLNAERGRELAAAEAGRRQTINDLRAQLSEARAEHTRLAALVEAHERQHDQIHAEHHQTVVALETSKRDTVSDLRSQLSTAAAEQTRLAAIVEQQKREHDRVTAEHRATIAKLETSKEQALAECERVLTEIKQAVLARPDVGAKVERRLIDNMEEAARAKASAEHIAGLQSGLTRAVSAMKHVLTHDAAAQQSPAHLAWLQEILEILERVHRQMQDLATSSSLQPRHALKLEALRTDILRAVTLARQLVPPNTASRGDAGPVSTRTERAVTPARDLDRALELPAKPASPGGDDSLDVPNWSTLTSGRPAKSPENPDDSLEDL